MKPILNLTDSKLNISEDSSELIFLQHAYKENIPVPETKGKLGGVGEQQYSGGRLDSNHTFEYPLFL